MTTFVMPEDAQLAAEWGRLAVFQQLTQDKAHRGTGGPVILRDEGAEVRHQASMPVQSSTILFGSCPNALLLSDDRVMI